MTSKNLVRKVAHDSGDGETIYHCPFCGSGQVVARSDRSIECNFCHTNFTVQVQPQFSAFPQTIDGQPVQVPGMPGQVGVDPSGASGGAPGDPGDMPPVDPSAVGDDGQVPPAGDQAPPGSGGDEDDDSGDSGSDDDDDSGDQPPWAKKSSLLRTAAGHDLPTDEYERHLAIRFARDPRQMASRIKEQRR